MDEIWQRHKTFILQCVVGGIALLVVWIVHANLYEDIDAMHDNNQLRLRQLREKLDKGEAPSRESIAAQQAIATKGEADLAAMIAKVAATAPTNVDYVRENVTAILRRIGNPQKADYYVSLYQQLALTCLYELKEEARSALAARAAQQGRTIDDTLGVAGAFQEDEVATAIHGLALVVETTSRALDVSVDVDTGNGVVGGVIDEIADVKISPRTGPSRMDRNADMSMYSTFSVSMTLRGDPDAVRVLLSGLNSTNNPLSRMTVVESIDVIERERPDNDRVRAKIGLLGIRYLEPAR